MLLGINQPDAASDIDAYTRMAVYGKPDESERSFL